MHRYEFLDASSLARVRVRSATLEELFETSGFAMFDLGYDLEGVTGLYPWPVLGAGDTWGELLDSWLDSLAAAGRARDLVFATFTVDRLEEGGVQGSASGLPSGDVPRRSRTVVGLAEPAVPIRTTSGWTVDLAFETVSRLHAV
jgi:SHS2 domain-containing protein